MAGFLAKRARPGWGLEGLLSAILLAAMAPSTAAAQHLQCVPYARQVSGIDLYGNAHLWWDKAEGRFGRGSEPRVGAVMAFRASAAMPLGHVAVVGEIVDERHILLNHANWSGPGMIERRALAEDVSDAGDWSAVRVWWGPQGALGARENPVSGFIYNEPPGTPGGSVLADAHRAQAGDG